MACLLSLMRKTSAILGTLVLVLSVSAGLSAEERPSRRGAPAGPLIEEDLPAREAPRYTPVAPVETVPLSPPPLVPEGPPPSVIAPPQLPEETTLDPQGLAALRFVKAGTNALEHDEWDRAREQFERAVAIAPLQPYGYYFLGRLAFSRGEHKQALAFLQKAELLFAPHDIAWLGETAGLKGAVYEDLGDYDQARIAYRRCLQLMPANLRALSALARLHEEEPVSSDTFTQ